MIINSFVQIANFLLLNLIFALCLVFDLTRRKVPNKYFKKFLIFSLILNTAELVLFYKNNISLFLLLKLIFIILAFITSLILFSLKIIGGSDGKLILLMILSAPVKFLTLRNLFSYFLLFSLSFIVLFVVNFARNTFFQINSLFTLFFDEFSITSKKRRYFYRIFFSFYNFSNLVDYKEVKCKIKFLIVIFNYRFRKLQLIAQIRPPLVIICIISYYIIYFLIVP